MQTLTTGTGKGAMACWVGWIVLLAVGCEPAPQAVSELPALPQPLVLADSEAGDYNWPLGASGFIVTKPPPFAFLRSPVGSSDVAEPSTTKVDMQPMDPETLDDLLSNVGTKLPHPFSQNGDFETLMSVELDGGEANAFCLSPDGSRLLVCGEQIRLYDTETGQQLSSEEVPGTALQASLWPLGEHFYVADENTIYQADANTGKILKPIGTLSDKLAMWQAALYAEVIFGCYENGKVFRLDGQSTQLTELGIKAAGASKQIGVKPDGTGVILTTASGLATYQLEDNRIVSEEINSVSEFGETVALCWSRDGRHWSNGAKIFSYPSEFDAERESKLNVSKQLLWRPIVMQAASHGKPDKGWVAGVVMRNDMAGKPTLSICEMVPDSAIHSVPTALPVAEGSPISLSRNAKIVAFANGSKLQVIQRRVWESCSLSRMRGGGWLGAGEFEQIDRFGQYLLATEEIRWGYSSQELYCELVEATAYEWRQLKYAIDAEQDTERKGKQRAVFEAARDWAKTSVLGQLALACLRMDMAWDARLGRAFPANSPSGWKLYEQQNQLASDEIDVVLADPDAPAAAFALRITAAARRGESYAQLEAVLKRGVARYASDFRLNQAVVTWLMPQWSGGHGDAASYLNAALKRCDPAIADIAYARAASLGLAFYEAPDSMYFHQKFDDARVIRGALAYLSQNPTDRRGLSFMLITATFAEDLEAQQQLACYYQSHFMFVDDPAATTYRNFISAVYNELP